MKRMNVFKMVAMFVLVFVMLFVMSACDDDPNDHRPEETVCSHSYGTETPTVIGTAAECIQYTKTCTKCKETVVTKTTKHAYTDSEPVLVYKGDVAHGYKVTSTCTHCQHSDSRWLTNKEIIDRGLTPIADLNATHIWVTNEVEVTKAEYDAYLAKNNLTDTVPVDEGYIAKYYRVTRSCDHCHTSENVVERRDQPDPNYKPTTPENPGEDTPVIPDPVPGEDEKECTHEYETNTVAATCTAKGYTQYTCKSCGKSYTSDYTSMRPHTYGAWTVTKKATCTVDGVEAQKCTACGDTQTRTLAKTGHSYSAWTVTTKATCTKDGVETSKCSGCGDAKTRTITKTGHNYGSWVTTKKATCTTDGTKTSTCGNCGATQTQTITKTGHAFSAWKTTQPTCTQNGSKSRTCSNCSKTESESIPATGHNWDEGKVTTTPTTCDDIGVKTYTCKTCGQKKVTQITGSHSFGEWEYEEYTYQVKGSFGKVYTYTSHRKVRYCTKCNFKEAVNTENHLCQIGSAVHNVTVEREGTCQVTKVYRSTCTICGWSTTYDNGEYGSHNVTAETKHLTDYSDYTNEVDVTIRTCSICKGKWYNYNVSKGYARYRMKYQVSCVSGSAYAHQNVVAITDDSLIKHPTWQMVTRNEKFDSQGYLIQWDYIWHDANGKRYSQTIKMEDIPAMFEAAGYDLSKYEGYASVSYHLIIDGNRVRPYKISFS